MKSSLVFQNVFIEVLVTDVNGNMEKTWKHAICQTYGTIKVNLLHSTIMLFLRHASSILILILLFLIPSVGVRPIYHYSSEEYWPFLTYFVILTFYVSSISLLINCRTFLKKEVEKFVKQHYLLPLIFEVELTLFAWRENVSGLELLSFFLGALLMSHSTNKVGDRNTNVKKY
jgi:hypothetical protein